jgi:post-segregation antitoxin (ccd killing protein)
MWYYYNNLIFEINIAIFTIKRWQKLNFEFISSIRKFVDELGYISQIY